MVIRKDGGLRETATYERISLTVFIRISAAALIKFSRLKCCVCLKIGRDKEIFSFILTVYFLYLYENFTVTNKSVF